MLQKRWLGCITLGRPNGIWGAGMVPVEGGVWQVGPLSFLLHFLVLSSSFCLPLQAGACAAGLAWTPQMGAQGPPGAAGVPPQLPPYPASPQLRPCLPQMVEWGYEGNVPPMEDAAFLEAAGRLPDTEIYEAIRRAEPLTPRACGGAPCRRRRSPSLYFGCVRTASAQHSTAQKHSRARQNWVGTNRTAACMRPSTPRS